MAEPWFADGLRFTCTQCGKCCTGTPGFVWVDDAEIDALAAAMGMRRNEFAAVYTRRTHGKVSLREKANDECVFYDATRGCTVYKLRPKQCRTWPFWESNTATEEDWTRTVEFCPGSGEGELIPVEEILKRVKAVKV